MEIIRACGLNIFLETASVRREMVWESITPPGHWLGTLLEGSLSVRQEGFGEHLWESGGGTIFSASEDVATRHVVLRDGSVAAVFVQIEAEMAEPLVGGDTLALISRKTPDPRLCLPEAARTIAWQMLGCPLQGPARRLYMTGKAMEMVAHVLDDATAPTNAGITAGWPARDIARVHEARSILLAELASPPSVPELARRVGTNAKKLGSGFQALFGTSVYGFVKANRLDAARMLLEGGETSIARVARRVGYQPQHFATEFRRRFGVAPTTIAGKAR
ncbi:AraC family transcriptional regulator [Shinella zoogloeoides]|uniref:helix-turn-helix transcriptional regulator n=1 Tax=Shinella zoogloeoides TaxID=352475 RepID=UPI00299DDABF|nr:AraC family transcriptional regulator [Shinella zoogloeoides]WPE22713.1 Regulatory protein PchR [Shinella zoogloeoides]